MTTSLTSSSIWGRWLALPAAQAVFRDLPARFLPWEVALAEVEARPSFSGYLEAVAENLSARAFWRDGRQLGAQLYASGEPGSRPAHLQQLGPDLADGHLSLYVLEPELSYLAHVCSFAEPETPLTPPQLLEAELASRGFSGVLRQHGPEGHRDLFWYGGRERDRGGSDLSQITRIDLFPAGESTGGGVDATRLLAFWNSVLALSGRNEPLERFWRAAALDLADDHPALDPFAGEISIQGNTLSVSSDVPLEELAPALLAAYRGALNRAGLRTADLELGALREQQPLVWRAAGLDTEA
ncbi:hypothetical protein HNR42_000931 [Deinobacterium chartae]|uniref:Uncharacterized protein n=1 Tax=Deinobacterium chartae TaxID=521158 RepID=A0A841HXY9_9DEIO|nr:hypothetical protein [Deinobacterium chartae]MBB6097514.1 hypothetical protein [Deinobacterium chartae]